MLRSLVLIACSSALIFSLSTSAKAPKDISSVENKTMLPMVYRAELNIKGMTCGGCSKGIENSLARQKGVLSVELDFEKSKAEVVFKPSMQRIADLIQVVERDGQFKAALSQKGVQAELRLKAPSCAGCVAKVNRKLKTLKGFYSFAKLEKSVSQQEGYVISFNPAELQAETLLKKLKSAGFVMSVFALPEGL